MSFTKSNDGTELYYVNKGVGSPIVFVSGFFGITDIWNSQIETLSADHQTIAYDNRGYGRSGKPESKDAYSILHHAEDLNNILCAAGVTEPVIIVAHSMGGNIATTFAVKYKEKVAGLVYVGAYVDGQQLRNLGARPEVLAETVSTPSGAVDFYRPFNIPERLLLEAAKWPSNSLISNAYAHVNYDLGDNYSQINVPVLIIHGSSDVPTPADPCGTGLQDAIPGARLEILAGINHFPSVEAAEYTTLLIKTLIRECE